MIIRAEMTTGRADAREYREHRDSRGRKMRHGADFRCGRQISDPHRSVKSRLKPPETDPPDDEHHHVTGHGYVDHEHGHHHDDHDHDDHDHDHDHHCHDHDHDHDHDHGDEHVYDHEYYHREGQFAENDEHVHDDVD